MGAGEFAAGDGGAGEDPVAAASPAVNLQPPAAAFLDLATRNLRVNQDGSYAVMHPADQAAQLSFMVRRGTLSSSPNIGHTFFEAPPLSGAAKQKDLDLRAQDAFPFRQLVAAKVLAFEGVEVQTPKFGETRIAIHYRNLVLDPTKTQTAFVSG